MDKLVKLNKIYTKTGDDGSTGLVNGERVPKNNLRVRAFGDVDETNSVIGIARLHLNNTKIDKMLSRIQNDLFDLGADLATPVASEDTKDNKIDLRINASQTLRLEKEMDKLNLDLLPLSSFILPGGAAPSAYLHQARTVCRRAERICVALESEHTLNKNALIYLNRLSDFLFIAARWCNNQGQTDVLWVPGGNSN